MSANRSYHVINYLSRGMKEWHHSFSVTLFIKTYIISPKCGTTEKLSYDINLSITACPNRGIMNDLYVVIKRPLDRFVHLRGCALDIFTYS